MKKFFTVFGVATLALYFTGFLSFGSWQAAGLSLGSLAILSLGLGLALNRESSKLRKRAKNDGRSVTSNERDGIRVYHPDGSQTFHRYR
jgi:membrane protein implicated in regulation of membrane protease activity